MHQTRAETSKKLPIARKGTKYVARQSSDLDSSVSVLFAVRDMLKIAKTAKEVKEMIKNKSLKLNNREVKDERQSLRLFNILHADKNYILKLNQTGKFYLEPTKSDERPCKVIGKTILSKGRVQLNLHDGSNVLSKDKVKINDTLYLDKNNKLVKHISFEKGSKIFVTHGKYMGNTGKIDSLENNFVLVSLEGNVKSKLEKESLIAL